MFNEASWKTWHDRRNEALAEPHGWLSLTSLTWIPATPEFLDVFPGLWWADESTAHVRFDAADTVTRGGEPALGEYSFSLEEDDSDLTLAHGSTIAEVAMRGGHYAVRVRDSRSPILANFTGVPTYDFAPKAVVEATFEPFAEPVDVPITTSNPRVPGVAHLVGVVRFEYEGVPCELRVQGGSGELAAIFFDRTNGGESADWRFVSFAAPAEGRNKVTIDFNRSLNFPGAFTPFGTCPMPPEGNELPVEVRAGERRP